MAMSQITRTLITKSTILSRSVTSKPLPSSPRSLIRSLVSLTTESPRVPTIPPTPGLRCFSTRQTTSSLNDPNPNWNNRPPNETILLEGCDFEHWLIVVEKPEGEPTRDEIIGQYIDLVASIVGSKDDARQRIYSVSTKHYFAIGVKVSEELSYKFKELPNVRWVLPDSYLNVREKDYGGEPFINGEAVPYDPKYHEEWVRNNARANERSRRNDRPRNSDRSRNFERRRENMQNRDFQAQAGNRGPPPPGPNMGGGPPAPGPNMGGPPGQGPNMGGGPPAPGPNMGGGPPGQGPNMGGGQYAPGPNMGGGPPGQGPNMGGGQYAPGPNMGGGQYAPNAPNAGGMPPYANAQNAAPVPQYANAQNVAPNYGGMPPNSNMQNGYNAVSPGPNGGYANNMPNYGPPNPNSGYSNPSPNAGNMQYRAPPNNGGMPYQNRDGPSTVPNREYQNQSSFTPNSPGNGPSGNAYQVRDVPGRDQNYQ